MIANYQKPQVLINEELDVDIPVATPTLNGFVFGPQYSLHRYGNPNDTPVQTGTAFVANTGSSAAQLVPYEGLTSNLIIDQTFGGLYGASLEGELWTASSYGNQEEGFSPYNFNLTSVNTANQIAVTAQGAIVAVTVTAGAITAVALVYAGSGYTPSSTIDIGVVQSPGANGAFRLVIGSAGAATSTYVISPGTNYLSGSTGTFDITGPSNPVNVGKASTSLISALSGRPIMQGDVLYATYNGVTARRTVQSVIQAATASAFGTDSASQNEEFAAGALNPTETDTATFGSQSAPPSWGVWPNHTGFAAINVTNSTGLTSGEEVLISAPYSLNSAQPGIATLSPTGGSNVAAKDVVEIFQPGPLTSIIVTAAGSGYTGVPTVAITGGGGTGATATAVLTTETVTSITITNGGSGYTSMPQIAFSGGSGTGASALPVVNNASVYTFVASLTPTAGQVFKGASIAASLFNLAAAINNTGAVNGAYTLYATGTAQNNLVTAQVSPSATGTATGSLRLTAINSGTASNSICVCSSTIASGTCEILVNGNAAAGTVPASSGTLLYGQNAQGSAWPVQQAEATIEDTNGTWSTTLNVPGSGYFHGGIVQTYVSAGGTGYLQPPEVVFPSPPTGGLQAQGVALVSGGIVTGVQITDPGKGYTANTALTVTLVGQNTAAATVYALVNSGVGFISVDTAGSGYAGGAANALGYTGIPNVLIGPPNTVWGTQATAVAVMTTSSGGGVAYIQILNPGSGYTVPPFVALDASQLSAGSGGVIGETVELLTTGPVVSSGSNSIATGTLAHKVDSNPGDWNGLVQGASYGGQYGERYTVTVTGVAAGEPPTATVRIRSADGVFAGNAVAAVQYGQNYQINDPSLGGLVIELAPPTAATPLAIGMQFSFTVIGKYVPLDLSSGGEVTSFNVTNAGSGYTGQPTIAITAPPSGGTQATAYCINDASTITSSDIIIDNPGSGYVYPPVVTITGGGGTGATALANITNPTSCRDLITNPNGSFSGPSNTQYQVKVLQGTDIGNTDNVETGAIVSVTDTAGIDTPQQYTLATGAYYPLGTYGLQFQFPANRYTPSGTSPDTATTATAIGVLASTDVSYITVTGGGSGYGSPPTVTITGSGGSAATATATITNGIVTGITVTAAGSGYTTCVVAIAAPTNVAQATGTATYNSINGELEYATVTAAGVGYVASFLLTEGNGITGGSGTGAIIKGVVENGTVIALQVIAGGSGYTGNPTLVLPPPQTYQPGLRTGDVYYVNALASQATGAYNTIVLSGSAVSIAGWSPSSVATNYLDINLAVLFSGLIPSQGDNPPTVQWSLGTAAQGGISVAPNLSIFVTNRTSNQWVLVQNSQYGLLYASWRGLVPTSATAPITAYANTDDLIAALGPQDYDNPVCWGGCIAINAAQGKPVFVASVATNDLPGFQALLNQALRMTGPTYLAPMTTNFSIEQAVQEHCDAASANNVRHFRRCYVASQNPGNYAVYVADTNGNPLTATIQSNGVGNVLVTSPNAQFITNNIQVGSLFQTQYGVDTWATPTYVTYVVQEVLEQDQLLLATGPNAPISPAIAFQIWAPNIGSFQATWAGNYSTKFSDRRASNVWCDTPQIVNAAGLTVNVWNPYLCAEIVGLRSIMPVQMGMTRTQLIYSVGLCPLMYTKYTDTALNVAAAQGTWIVTQDYTGGPVYVRHQLTTNSSNGPLYYEDSVGVSLDAIAYDVDALMEPYIGARNANIENLEEIDTGMRTLLDSYLQSIPGYEEIGPILAAWSGLSVTIPVNAVNTIDIYADMDMPTPIGIINVTLRASQINGQTLITINTSANTGATSGTDTGAATTNTQA